MTVYIALLRAVNVGGTGKLPMSELRDMCEKLGYSKVKTYIASGNVLFESSDDASTIKSALEHQLETFAGKRVGVIVRSAKQMGAILDANPFPNAGGNRTVAIFLDPGPIDNALEAIRGQKTEQIVLGEQEIYVHYPDGIGDSKLVIPAAKAGTARNMNTVKKLVELSQS